MYVGNGFHTIILKPRIVSSFRITYECIEKKSLVPGKNLIQIRYYNLNKNQLIKTKQCKEMQNQIIQSLKHVFSFVEILIKDHSETYTVGGKVLAKRTDYIMTLAETQVS